MKKYLFFNLSTSAELLQIQVTLRITPIEIRQRNMFVDKNQRASFSFPQASF